MLTLSADKLEQFGDPFVCDAAGCSLSSIREALTPIVKDHSIPMGFDKGQVKSGSLFNRQVDECLVLHHPQHYNDYLKFCVVIKPQGTKAFIRVYSFGTSSQAKKAVLPQLFREQRRGKSLSYKIGNLAAQAIMTSGRNKAKLEQEQDYYALVGAALTEALSS